ncbi:MAG: hypothetical protein COW85_08775 [Ignavibacteria bacterium CG22_combo_CG10-13_8_21_14_all_37_15]|nr:MAG: hypothetical protein COW85_08775 [Ignavibacteria bacterium CG22_combo_CG10-13_8_21_14_all_37_15]
MKNLLLLLLGLFISAPIFAQQKLSASFESLENKIQITYEFQGETDKEYEIKVSLKRSSLSTFKYSPVSLSGNVGKGKYANRKNLIIWNLTNKEAETLTDTDYFFEITAIEVKGGIPWYYYVGTAVVGGGAAAVLLLKKKTEDKPETTTAMPPARP